MTYHRPFLLFPFIIPKTSVFNFLSSDIRQMRIKSYNFQSDTVDYDACQFSHTTLCRSLSGSNWLLVQLHAGQVGVLVDKCFNGSAPDYLPDDCRWTRHHRPGLRSSYWKSHQPERRSATDPLLSMDHTSGTVYRHQFTTKHCQLLSLLINLKLISLFNSCSVRDSEQTLI